MNSALGAISIFAASTQRTIGLLIGIIAIGGFLIYWFFNWIAGRKEIGVEIYTAPNRRPGMPDEQMETRRLDMGLATGLLSLMIIGVALPLYWLGEPGRQEGRIRTDDRIAIAEGEHLYEERCAQCHGTVSGAGGNVDHVLLDNNGIYLANVSWRAPSLSAVLYRYSEDEVRYVVDYGRPNTPMPAWGGPGGGPFTTQQVDNVIAYLEYEQILPVTLQERVDAGVINTAREMALEIDPSLQGNPTALETATREIMDRASTNQELLGKLLFNNVGDSGAYGCARCHTPGWSYDANEHVAPTGGLIGPEVPGGGGFGPGLANGSTLRQFDTPLEHQTFVKEGSQNGVSYGNFGQGDGGGQMPSFGLCVGDRDAGDRDRIKRNDFCLTHGTGTLSGEQLEAIVAYERGRELNQPAVESPQDALDASGAPDSGENS